ncbi:MAG: phage shock protein A [Deltaproteobacteria bacterium HGW-Deltaproteobacteria-15]|jgi:phage shock protein A|nr:MAG: phage shock protein A [Deltaproteobacteria bacterium HGW-Deltaproteobacteria-15]
MGIFTRFRDIISSNINSMLDKSEDPEKLVKIIIREMEDTLVELKASCARGMAGCRKIQRQTMETGEREKLWDERAVLAVKKGRNDLAREALVQKRRFTNKGENLRKELDDHNALVARYQEDIRELTDRLQNAREKQRTLVHRQIYANGRMRAQQKIRSMESTDAVLRFEEMEKRLESIESGARYTGKTRLESEFDTLLEDEEIEKEFEGLKSSLTPDEADPREPKQPASGPANDLE